MRKYWTFAQFAGAVAFLATVPYAGQARDASAVRPPTIAALSASINQAADHNVGRISLTMVNIGTFGYGHAETRDVFTGEPVLSCVYPTRARAKYLWNAALWVGAVLGTDTLVSTSADNWFGCEEFTPEAGSDGALQTRSTLQPTYPGWAEAISHQDILATYYDTCMSCPLYCTNSPDRRPHIPLGLRVDQISYAWMFDHADDFVIITYRVTNILGKQLRKAYVGICVDSDVYPTDLTGEGATDDLSGFIAAPMQADLTKSYSPNCAIPDSIKLAWTADNDGDLLQPVGTRVPHITAVQFLEAPTTAPTSFNWWRSNGDASADFGPQGRTTFRLLEDGGTGTPVTDADKYWLMRNQEFDYDQYLTKAITPVDDQWVYPPQDLASDITDGIDTRYLYSFGPFDLDSGQTITIAIAYAGGMDLHTDPYNGDKLGNMVYDPYAYRRNLNFENLLINAQWAAWVFDNPGYDSDMDGYAGKFTVCEDETLWYAGDDIPDLVAADAPVAPVVQAHGDSGSIIVRWNGWRSETTPDRIHRAPDFEGYNVLLRKADSSDAFALVSSFDKEDYLRVRYDFQIGDWDVEPVIFTIEELRFRYAPEGTHDSSWSPLAYNRVNPLFWGSSLDSVFYFLPVGCNASRYGKETGIVRQYPDAPRPIYASPSDVPPEDSALYLDEQGQFKYYDYELTIDDLLPGQAYAVGVEAFDWGTGGETFFPLLSPRIVISPVVPGAPGCCQGLLGNIDCDSTGRCDVGDLTALLGHLFLSNLPLCCPEAANLDRSPDGSVDISDLATLIDYLFVRCESPGSCD